MTLEAILNSGAQAKQFPILSQKRATSEALAATRQDASGGDFKGGFARVDTLDDFLDGFVFYE
jgi:hypothetical protein